MNPGAYMLLIVWSLFAMHLILRYLNHKKFNKQMREILAEEVDRELYRKVEPFVIRLFESHVKKFLLESKVVNQHIEFRWTNKEKSDAN